MANFEFLGVSNLDNMMRSGHRKLARSFNLCFRYIDDLIVFNNKKSWEYVKDLYPSQFNVERTNQSDNLASYLDLTFTIEKDERRSTKLYDKRDDFDFHIVNFPFVSSNITSGPSYGVYISQFIRYARCCSYYDTMMISDIAIKCQLKGLCLRDINMNV